MLTNGLRELDKKFKEEFFFLGIYVFNEVGSSHSLFCVFLFLNFREKIKREKKKIESERTSRKKDTK